MDKTKLSCLVTNSVYTADTDKTVLSCPCRRCEIGLGMTVHFVPEQHGELASVAELLGRGSYNPGDEFFWTCY